MFAFLYGVGMCLDVLNVYLSSAMGSVLPGTRLRATLFQMAAVKFGFTATLEHHTCALMHGHMCVVLMQFYNLKQHHK